MDCNHSNMYLSKNDDPFNMILGVEKAPTNQPTMFFKTMIRYFGEKLVSIGIYS